MVDAVETMAYKGETPWHGLGATVKDGISVDEMLKAAKLDWTVSKKPVQIAGSNKPVPGKFALVRDTDGQFLSMVGKGYKPAQNKDTFEFFREFVEAGHMKMDTAGSLQNGQYVWGLANIQESFSVGKDDEVKGNLLLVSPFRIGRSLLCLFTPERVVCWNTLQMALSGDRAREKEGKGHRFRMPHSIQFDKTVMEEAKIALGLSKEMLNAFKEQAEFLSKKKVKKEFVHEYFMNVLELDKKDLEDSERVPPNLALMQKALEFAPGAQLQSAKGTMWGALNAVTYVVDHELGNDRQTALRSAWIGKNARLKVRALNLALAVK